MGSSFGTGNFYARYYRLAPLKHLSVCSADTFPSRTGARQHAFRMSHLCLLPVVQYIKGRGLLLFRRTATPSPHSRAIQSYGSAGFSKFQGTRFINFPFSSCTCSTTPQSAPQTAPQARGALNISACMGFSNSPVHSPHIYSAAIRPPPSRSPRPPRFKSQSTI